jgi:hypothetical protein
MLTNICQYLHNYFEYEKHFGLISIIGDVVFCDGEEIEMGEGQYFALFRERYAIGVYQKGDELTDKTFQGSVWLMDIPDAILKANQWAEQWMEKNGGVDSAASSPFQSESFGGYSYSKGNNSVGKVGVGLFDQANFVGMLAPYRKLP